MKAMRGVPKGVKFATVAILVLEAIFVGALLKSQTKQFIKTAYATATATAGVQVTVTVLDYITMSVTTGGTISFGNLTPGSPNCDSSGSIVSVTTNSTNGYILSASDGVADPNSALVNGGTYITDFTGDTLPTAPVVWGSGTGLGVGLWTDSATQKDEGVWGAGAAACDAANKYSGVPQNATTFYTKTGYSAGATTSSWSWKIDVPNTQKTGAYTGTVQLTAVAVLS